MHGPTDGRGAQAGGWRVQGLEWTRHDTEAGGSLRRPRVPVNGGQVDILEAECRVNLASLVGLKNRGQAGEVCGKGKYHLSKSTYCRLVHLGTCTEAAFDGKLRWEGRESPPLVQRWLEAHRLFPCVTLAPDTQDSLFE